MSGGRQVPRLAPYIAIETLRALAAGDRAETSIIGLALTAGTVSLAAMASNVRLAACSPGLTSWLQNRPNLSETVAHLGMRP
jgi:hypothetical protein